MNSPCSTTPGTSFSLRSQGVEVLLRRRAGSRGCGGPRRSGRAGRPLRRAARPRAAAASGGAACPASAKRTTSTGSRKCSPRRSTRFGVSATTTNRRAAEITIFSRSSAPPPPLIRRSSGSTSSAPSSARSSSSEPSSSTISIPARPASSRRPVGGHRGAHVELARRQVLDHRPDRAARAQADGHPRLHQRRRPPPPPRRARSPAGAHAGSIAAASTRRALAIIRAQPASLPSRPSRRSGCTPSGRLTIR